jgi:hypothetical protein
VAIPSPPGWLVLGALAAALAAGLLTLRREVNGATLFLLCWAVAYIVFLWWWLPGYEHPFLIAAIPIVVLAALLANRLLHGRLRRLTAVAALMLLAAVNARSRVLPMHSDAGDSYHEAAKLAAVDGGCVYLTSYRIWNHLRYYFGRSDSARLGKYPLIHMYRGQRLPDAYARVRTSCVLVDAELLRPDYTIEGYNEAGLNGFTAPRGWLAHLEWLLALEYDSSGRVNRTREFHLVPVHEGRDYVRVENGKRDAAGLEDVLGALDSGGEERPESAYRRWLRANQRAAVARIR